MPAIGVRDYGDSKAIAIPAPLTLDADAYYVYALRVREDASNVLRWNRVGGICFSTGATSPSGASVCSP